MAETTSKTWSGGSIWVFMEEMQRYSRNVFRPLDFTSGTVIEVLSKKLKIQLSDSSIIYGQIASTTDIRIGSLVLLLVKTDFNGRKTYSIQNIKYVGSLSDSKSYSV
jgi:hypothetical protein